MSEDNSSPPEQPVYQFNPLVQQLAADAAWVQGFNQAVLTKSHYSAAEIEIVTRLAKAVCTLKNDLLSPDAWQAIATVAVLGSLVAKDLTVAQSAQNKPSEVEVPNASSTNQPS